MNVPLLAAMCFSGALCGQDPVERAEMDAPNVVLIFTDDQGYGDLSCAGHPTIHTPRIDALVAGGMRCTQFYTGSPVCSPSRAALLTGCYPKRVSMHKHVVFPQYDYGLHPEEATIADLLSARGYATGCFGKWHLGHRRGMLPVDQGFDVYLGIPYSNDMSQFHRRDNNRYDFRLPLLQGDKVVEWEPDQHLLTQRITDAAIDFIDDHRQRPFFLYVPHPMPHIPIYASESFAGRSPRGTYGDVIEELDASVGRIVDALRQRDLEQKTLVIFASDNGPWKVMKQDGGSAGPLRGAKGTNWEGGQRVPFVASWPGKIRAGHVCREVITAMDVLPTLASLCGAELPAVPIDGHDVQALWFGDEGARSKTQSFVYYTSNGKLAGIRRGPWKLLLDGDQLFHLEHDISEARNVASKRPQLVEELRALVMARDAEIEGAMRPVFTSEELVFDPRKDASGR